MLAQRTRTHVLRHPCLRLSQVLEQERHPGERPPETGLGRRRARGLELLVHEHVQLASTLQPGDRRLHKLKRRHLTAADQRRLLGDVLQHQLSGQGPSL